MWKWLANKLAQHLKRQIVIDPITIKPNNKYLLVIPPEVLQDQSLEELKEYLGRFCQETGMVVVITPWMRVLELSGTDKTN